MEITHKNQGELDSTMLPFVMRELVGAGKVCKGSVDNYPSEAKAKTIDIRVS